MNAGRAVDFTLRAETFADEATGDVAIAERLRADGLCVVDDFLDASLCADLLSRAQALEHAGALIAAGVGQGAARQWRPELRGDRTAWLDESRDAVEAAYLARMMRLRASLNRATYLGLDDIETHFALYPPGTRYGVHRDRFRDDDRRVVSSVCYLNADWPDDAGGALRIYLDAERAHWRDVMPRARRLVVFLSAEFEHEVLPATRARWSIAGWMRARA